MADCKDDIRYFHLHVKSLISKLRARGEEFPDLIINLFRGYEACCCSEFTSYIQRKRENYEENAAESLEQLMIHAQNKYDSLHELGRW